MSVSRLVPGRKTFVAILCFLAFFLGGDTLLRHRELERVTNLRTSEVPVETTRVSPEARPRSVVLSPTTMDGRWWVIHAEEFLRGNSWRVRHTALDNAPGGREVHWSSGLVWLLGGLASVCSSLTGKSAVDCVSQAAFWAGPCLLLLSGVLFGWIIIPRFGAGLAAIFILLYCTSPVVYQGFRAGETDHHGLVTTFSVASLLCLVAAGGGLVKGGKRKAPPGHFVPFTVARKGFILSGLLGGAALWVSAASFIPILGGCGMGAVLVFLLRDREYSQAEPRLWRVWGLSGCFSSLFFYILEYVPHHMGWRLEVNHPLYALAWLGAGDLLARSFSKWEGKPFFPSRWKSGMAATASVVCIALPAFFVLLEPRKFFWVSDKFLLLLHNEFIQEFESLPRMFGQGAGIPAFLELFTWPFFVLTGSFLMFRSGTLSRMWGGLLCLGLAPAFVMQGLAVWQIRWSVLSTGIWMVCVLIVLAAWLERREGKVVPVLFGAAVLFAVLPLPMSCLWILINKDLCRQMPKAVIPTLLARDVAHRLIQASPSRLPVVLSGPTTSTDLTYYAGIKTIGTLYWENTEGLKRAAEIFAAPDEQTAGRLVEKAGITHIVVSTWDNFGKAYVELLRKAGVSVPPAGETFIEKLLRENKPPDWLRPLYYPIPAGFGIEEERMRIYAVVPEQSHFQALLHRGIYHFEAGEYDRALTMFSEAGGEKPGDPQVLGLIAAAREKLAAQQRFQSGNSASPGDH